MNARRPIMATLACLCTLAGMLAAGGVPATAAVTQFGTAGQGAGELNQALGLGLDRETGDLYVPEFYNNRVSKFDGSGNFQFAWGWKVNQTNALEELQTCTTATGCRGGEGGPNAGQFAETCGAQAAAVDNEPLSSSYNDVYVVDFCSHRVQKFGPSGNFLLTFGGHVNETTGGDVCVSGEACTRGTEGSGNGEFEWAYEHSYIAVGPGGAVYVGDKARVQVFEPSGSWKENISLAGLSSEGKVTALAVDSSGDMFVADQEVSSVREFEPDGVEKATQFDAGSTSVEAITVDPTGDLFVADSGEGFHVLEYDSSSGKQLASFGQKTAGGTAGIVFSETSDELYVSAFSSVWVLTPPPPGPSLESGSETATAGLHGTATFEALVNPEGTETTYHFEYVDLAQYEASGYADAVSTAPTSAGSSFEAQLATATATQLPPAVYHYRIVVTSSQGTVTGPDQTFETAFVEGPWATGVYATSATLSANVNPFGTRTEYRIEYGTSQSYGYTLSGNVGEGANYVLIPHHLQELEPGTTYHYRVVLINEFGTFETSDHTFTTQPAKGESALPDGRQWELVSPANKDGAVIEPMNNGELTQAANAGGAIVYSASGPHVGGDPLGTGTLLEGRTEVLSRREPEGWTSLDVTLPARPQPEGKADRLVDKISEGYVLASEDLSQMVLASRDLLAPDVNEKTLYLRQNSNGSYLPLVSELNVPPGTKYGGSGHGLEEDEREYQLYVSGATPDLSHVVFESPLALTPEALGLSGGEARNLYEWSAGKIQLVSILSDGSSTEGELAGESGIAEGSPVGAAGRAISSNGQRIAWEGDGLNVRDMVAKKTVRVGNAAVFQGMNSEGTRIFYREDGDLYEYYYPTGAATDLTADHGTGESSAGVQQLAVVSEDGSYVYFVADGVLSAIPNADGEAATPGHCVNQALINRETPPTATCNLYVVHDNGGVWEAPRFIASLSGADEASWFTSGTYQSTDLPNIASRVSPNGHYFAFMSERSLTGYNNHDVISGQPDEEVYLYDAAATRLVCASCNPTGARPLGVFDRAGGEGFGGDLLVDRPSIWSASNEEHWLAGNIPGWDEYDDGGAEYQPRYLSSGGRLFFNSPDALVPQATNGLEDVYEYEPPAGGEAPASDTCTTESSSYSARSKGCVSLISSGTSNAESVFYDASENGDDVFFVTSAKLVSEDYDDSYDVYDAHVCSEQAPCRVAPVSSPPCTSGDSCKAAPSPQPEIFGAPPSATFNGVGNVMEAAKPSTVKHKTGKPRGKAAKKRKKKHKKKTKGVRASRTAGAKAHR